jgi:hypothetical protein
MSLVKVKARSKAHRVVSARPLVNSVLLELLEQGVTLCDSSDVNSEASAHASDVLDVIWMLLLQLLKSLEQECARGSRFLAKIFFSNNFDKLLGKDKAHRVSHIGVEVAVRGDHVGLLTVVEAGREHLLGEGHVVGWRGQIPMLERPHFSRGTYASLNLINDHVYAELFCQVPQTLRKCA